MKMEDKKPFFSLGQCAKMLFPLASHSKKQCEEAAQFTVDLKETEPGKMQFVPLCTKHGIEIAVQKFVHHHINAFPSFLTDKEIAKMLEIETNLVYISKLAEAQNGRVRVTYYKGDLFWEDVEVPQKNL